METTIFSTPLSYAAYLIGVFLMVNGGLRLMTRPLDWVRRKWGSTAMRIVFFALVFPLLLFSANFVWLIK